MCSTSSQRQRRLLEKLTVFTVCAGRYPRAKQAARRAEYAIFKDDWANIEKILGRVEAADQELRTVRFDPELGRFE